MNFDFGEEFGGLAMGSLFVLGGRASRDSEVVPHAKKGTHSKDFKIYHVFCRVVWCGCGVCVCVWCLLSSVGVEIKKIFSTTFPHFTQFFSPNLYPLICPTTMI